MTIAAMDDNLVSTTSTTRDISSKETILDAIHFCSQRLAAGEGSDYSQLVRERCMALISSGDGI